MSLVEYGILNAVKYGSETSLNAMEGNVIKRLKFKWDK